MKDIGIRELKMRASKLVRQVEEDGATYTITRHGRAVGQLVPPTFAQPPTTTTDEQSWRRMLELMATIRAEHHGRRSALTELSKMRR